MEKLVDMLVPSGNHNIILDPFAGSGTTLVAAEKLGRSYIGIEIVSDYISIINRRIAEVENTATIENSQPSDEDNSSYQTQLDF